MQTQRNLFITALPRFTKRTTGLLALAMLAVASAQGAKPEPPGIRHRQTASNDTPAGIVTDKLACLRIVSREVSSNQPSFHGAVYAEPKGMRLLGTSQVSDDNGQTWHPVVFQPDLNHKLPYGYRREQVTSVCDRRTGRLVTILNALDTPGLDPQINEPAIAQNTYYLRYRISKDGGRTWLLDDPIVQTGAYDAKHPVEGVWVGKNAIYLGDAGCIPIVARNGKILVPAQLTPLAPDGTLWNPSGGHTFTEVVVLIGTWTKGGRLKWEASQRVCGDPDRTTRGLIEPTLAEFPDGRILMVMRGSNGGKADPQHRLPSCKWFSVSGDSGRTWSKAEPWTWDDRRPFFSPSSMSTLFKHSSGRWFWVGNVSVTNCTGNLPRWPLVMGEVDARSLRLVRRSRLVVDTEQPSDRTQGRLDISHVTLFEDRQTQEIVLTYPRAHHAYQSYEWVTARLALNPAAEVAVGSDKPPAPYTPIKASPSAFRCLGRNTELGALLLPKQVISADRPLLAGPVRLVTEPDILGGVRGKSRVMQKTGDKAVWEWAGESQGLRVLARMSGECDGFCWYEIELAPKQPVKLNSIRLEIPRVAATARYLHTANFSWTHFSQGLPEAGDKWSDNFTPYVWLGDEERGLAWCAESDQGWLLREPKKAVEVQTKGDVVVFRASVLDHEEVLSTPITLRFGLQGSPVKPVSFAWRAKARLLHGINYESCRPGAHGRTLLDTLKEEGVKTVVFHQDWSEYYGQVSPWGSERLRRLIHECHRRDLKLLVYIGYGLARTAPELQGHHDEWSVMPLIPWTTPHRTEFEAFDATCARSEWADWLVAGIDRLFSECELDGLYFDGTSEAWRCQNQAHGCGWKDAGGTVHAEYPMLATRQMMRRIADAVHRHRPNAILDVHMSASLSLPTLAFCDSYWNGEQFETYTAGDKFALPLHAFRTEFMGYAHGLDAQFLCYEKRPFTLDEAIALAWLHGVEVRPFPATVQQISPIWRAMDAFGATSAKWLPYWNGSGAAAEDESVKISAYSKPRRALLFIGHLKRQPIKTNIQLDRRRLDLAPGKLSAVDAVTRSDVVLDGNTLPISFDAMSWRLIEIQDKDHR